MAVNILLKSKMLQAGDIKPCQMRRLLAAECNIDVTKSTFSRIMNGQLTSRNAELITDKCYAILDRIIAERNR